MEKFKVVREFSHYDGRDHYQGFVGREIEMPSRVANALSRFIEPIEQPKKKEEKTTRRTKEEKGATKQK